MNSDLNFNSQFSDYFRSFILEKRGLVVCIMPSMAQYLQQLLPPFTWTHALTPLRCSWGDAKKLMGRLLSHSSKFVEEILDAWIFCITLPPKI